MVAAVWWNVYICIYLNSIYLYMYMNGYCGGSGSHLWYINVGGVRECTKKKRVAFLCPPWILVLSWELNNDSPNFASHSIFPLYLFFFTPLPPLPFTWLRFHSDISSNRPENPKNQNNLGAKSITLFTIWVIFTTFEMINHFFFLSCRFIFYCIPIQFEASLAFQFPVTPEISRPLPLNTNEPNVDVAKIKKQKRQVK